MNRFLPHRVEHRRRVRRRHGTGVVMWVMVVVMLWVMVTAVPIGTHFGACKTLQNHFKCRNSERNLNTNEGLYNKTFTPGRNCCDNWRDLKKQILNFSRFRRLAVPRFSSGADVVSRNTPVEHELISQRRVARQNAVAGRSVGHLYTGGCRSPVVDVDDDDVAVASARSWWKWTARLEETPPAGDESLDSSDCRRAEAGKGELRVWER